MNRPFTLLPRILRIAIRLALILAVAVIVSLALNWLQARLGTLPGPGGRLMLGGVVLLGLIIYAALMAIPFVPGVEIGVSLLMMQGPRIAPFVFLATFSGLTLAFLLGKRVRLLALHSLLSDLGLVRAAEMVDVFNGLDREARLARLQETLPRWLRGPLLRWRYVSVALALNVPGNAVLGGGGGIAMAAGLSGLFRTSHMLLTFALAVSPVPIAVMLFGRRVLELWQAAAPP